MSAKLIADETMRMLRDSAGRVDMGRLRELFPECDGAGQGTVQALPAQQRQLQLREARRDADLLSRLSVMGTKGPVPLSQVAEIALDSGPTQIDRYDRLRNINFEIELNQQPLGLVL